ncbi:uncharacterized protein [Parasteatoda tepidariorum]|uniref:uncharacterized protein n=1 Tax=Parasteatoda tepidariorum TaxID=114398 RepID=UPI001C726A97|nr:uncharacterized protein LOC122270825 [Parasteatoda tepidariorum]
MKRAKSPEKKRKTRKRHLDMDESALLNNLFGRTKVENTLDASTFEKIEKKPKKNWFSRLGFACRKKGDKKVKTSDKNEPIVGSSSKIDSKKRKSWFHVPTLLQQKKGNKKVNHPDMLTAFQNWINKRRTRKDKKKPKKSNEENEEVSLVEKRNVLLGEKLRSSTDEPQTEDSESKIYDDEEYLKYTEWVEEEYERILALFN